MQPVNRNVVLIWERCYDNQLCNAGYVQTNAESRRAWCTPRHSLRHERFSLAAVLVQECAFFLAFRRHTLHDLQSNNPNVGGPFFGLTCFAGFFVPGSDSRTGSINSAQLFLAFPTLSLISQPMLRMQRSHITSWSSDRRRFASGRTSNHASLNQQPPISRSGLDDNNVLTHHT